MTLNEYAKKWDRDTDNNFAVACYEQNSIAELEEALQQAPDDTDIATWRLESEDEWRDAMTAALAGCE